MHTRRPSSRSHARLKDDVRERCVEGSASSPWYSRVLGAPGLELSRDFREAKQRVQTAQAHYRKTRGFKLSTEFRGLVLVKAGGLVVARMRKRLSVGPDKEVASRS